MIFIIDKIIIKLLLDHIIIPKIKYIKHKVQMKQI